MQGRKAAFITLGCKVNTYETEAMKKIFEKNGYQIVEPNGFAEVYVVNTCTVTRLSDRKSRQMIRRARKENPAAIIAAVGCYAQAAPEELAALDEVNLVIGNNHKAEILQWVEKASCDTQQIIVSERKTFDRYEELWAGSFSGQTRGFLKIQDGCDQFCSYCIIPYARGRSRSRHPDSVLKEAGELSRNGFKEIVLTGIHLTSFGADTGEGTLADMIAGLHEIKGLQRIRLGSLEPFHMTEEVIRRLAGMEKLCPHFHLSLQSGCNETLQRMNRKYSTQAYHQIVQNIRKYFADVAITTDIMTGFPGETDEEFRITCEFIRQIGFSQAHIFQYSPRKGTRAADMPDQIPSAVKEERSKKLFEICDKSKRNYREQYLGRKMEVLFEKQNGGVWEGLTRNYIPTEVVNNEIQAGEIREIYLLRQTKECVLGQIV